MNRTKKRLTYGPNDTRDASFGSVYVAVRVTADSGAELAGDPKLNIFTE